MLFTNMAKQLESIANSVRKEYPRGELLWSEVHKSFVRYLRTEHDGMIAVADRNTMKELPDLVHATQVRRA